MTFFLFHCHALECRTQKFPHKLHYHSIDKKKMEKLSNEEKKLDKDFFPRNNLALVTNTLILFSHHRTYESGNLIFVFHSIVR